MRQILLAIYLSCAGFAALAQSDEIEANISAQIEAFKVDDFEKAFSFASPNIREIFGSAQNFGTMVREGYPMVWRPAEVRFLELREIGGRYWQKVLITDQAGGAHVLDYQMISGENGWKINGVQILDAPGAAA